MNSMKGGCCGGGDDRGEILCSTFSSKRLYLFIAIWRIWKNDKKLVFLKSHLGDLEQNLSDCFPVTKLRIHMLQMTGLLSYSRNLTLLKCQESQRPPKDCGLACWQPRPCWSKVSQKQNKLDFWDMLCSSLVVSTQCLLSIKSSSMQVHVHLCFYVFQTLQTDQVRP